MYSSNTRDHVNFKSLLTFFDINHLDNLSIDEVIKALIKTQLLNKFNYDLLYPLLEEQLTLSTGSDYFDVESILPSKEIEKALHNNVLDTNRNTVIITDTVEVVNPRL